MKSLFSAAAILLSGFIGASLVISIMFLLSTLI